MPQKRLTPTNVLTLPTKRRPYQVWDYGTDAAQGLSVLVSPGGIRTYRATYYYPGSTKALAVKLGRVGEMSLDEARTKTRDIRGLARKGLDPKLGDPAKSSNFKSAIETWTQKEQIGRKQNKSADECERFVLASTTAWHARPVAAIRKGEIQELLEVKREERPYAANRLHAHLSTFFRWCFREERIQINPMYEMPRPWDGAKARDRPWFKREAADEVIRKLWQLAGKLGGDEEVYIKLLIITGKRKEAVRTIDWAEISSDWYWAPTVGNKHKHCHAIPLPRLAQRVLGKHQKSGKALGHFSVASLVKKARVELPLPDFFIHGIRHIVETKMGELRLPKDTRNMVLDHSDGRGSGKDYDHHDYRDEMLEALETWCAHIEKLVTPKGKARQRARS